MSSRSLPRSVQPAVIGFLALTALSVASVIASRTGLIDVSASRRVIGVLVGLMAMLTGNFIPKMRPLGGVNREFEIVAAAELTAGWILMLLGASYALLFAFAPIALVRSTAPLIALVGLALVAGNWIWVAVMPKAVPPGTEQPSPASVQRRNLAVKLMFALTYVLVVASLKMVSDGAGWTQELATWSLISFCIVQAVMTLVLDRRRR